MKTIFTVILYKAPRFTILMLIPMMNMMTLQLEVVCFHASNLEAHEKNILPYGIVKN